MLPILDEAIFREMQLTNSGPAAAGLAGLFRAGEPEGVQPLEPDFVVLRIGRLRNLKAAQLDTDCQQEPAFASGHGADVHRLFAQLLIVGFERRRFSLFDRRWLALFWFNFYIDFVGQEFADVGSVDFVDFWHVDIFVATYRRKSNS